MIAGGNPITRLMLSDDAHAQMDDKFYFPGKTLQPMDGVTYEQVFLPIDTIA